MTSDDLIEVAEQIGARICRAALWDGERCTWFGPVPAEARGVPAAGFATLESDLYAGTAGLALMLSELASVTGRADLAAAALGAARQSIATVSRTDSSHAAGLYAGVGGVALSLVRCGRLLRQEDLVTAGAEMALRMQPIALRSHRDDLIGGRAGTVLCSVILAKALGDPRLLDQAASVARYLMARARRTPDGLTWPQPRGAGTSSVGFAHGGSGIAHALLETALASDDHGMMSAAREAMRYEDSRIDLVTATWPDERARPDADGDAAQSVAFWCHGGAGIGLARAYAADRTGEDEPRRHAVIGCTAAARWIEAAMQMPGEGFSLCHGLAGNAEVAWDAACLLASPNPAQLAVEVARFGADRYLGRGVLWPCGIYGGEPLGLMLGLAGIARFYLRLARPEEVCSVLLPRADERW